jgi:hypothetical protein
MRRAKRHVQIHSAPGGPDLHSRLSMSSGTRVATETDARIAAYESGARIPRGPWRLPTAEEFDLLKLKHPVPDYGRLVALLRLPRPHSFRQIEAIWRDDPDAVERGLFAPILDACEIGEPIACIGTKENPPNLDTTTVDPKSRAHIGLHVDSWHAPYSARSDDLPNRVSVNVGFESRYFLFLPVSSREMRQILEEETGEISVPHSDRTGLGRLFMERFPSTPVVRCRIAPWEAYLAPTENLVHDGSSLGQSDKDRHYTLLGQIRLVANRCDATPEGGFGSVES